MSHEVYTQAELACLLTKKLIEAVGVNCGDVDDLMAEFEVISGAYSDPEEFDGVAKAAVARVKPDDGGLGQTASAAVDVYQLLLNRREFMADVMTPACEVEAALKSASRAVIQARSRWRNDAEGVCLLHTVHILRVATSILLKEVTR